jgi:hypothetical protein
MWGGGIFREGWYRDAEVAISGSGPRRTVAIGYNRPEAVLHDNQFFLARSSDLLERIHLDSINGTGLGARGDGEPWRCLSVWLPSCLRVCQRVCP